MRPRIKRNLTQAEWLTIIVNLLPVIGVWFLGWSAVEAFIVYAMETLILGGMTVLKLLIATISRKKDTWYNKGTSTQVSGLFFIFFFIMHFGLFALVQTSIFAESADINPPGKGMTYFFFHWYDYINEDIAIMLGAFIVNYLVRSLWPFLRKKEYLTAPMMLLMFQPYGRVFVQQFTVILGSMFLGFGFDKGFILVFALAKAFFEGVVDFDGLIKKSVDDMIEEDSRARIQDSRYRDEDKASRFNS